MAARAQRVWELSSRQSIRAFGGTPWPRRVHLNRLLSTPVHQDRKDNECRSKKRTSPAARQKPLKEQQTAAPTPAATTVEPTARQPLAKAPLTAARIPAGMTVARMAVPMVAQTAVPTVAQTAERTAALTPDLALRSGPQVSDLRPALSRCLTIDTDRFAVEHWGQAPLLSATTGFTDLFSSDAVDELLTVRGIRTPFLRMARNGQILAAATYTSTGGVGATVTDQADPAKIHALMAEGATLVLQGLHRTWAPLQEFARQLHDDLGHAVQVNAYVTPPGAQGFSPHYDTHDVFVLQIAGTKDWQIHRPVIAAPGPDQPWSNVRSQVASRASEPAYLTTTLTPGDCLYLPRGWLHSAVADDRTSIHVTIGIHPLTTADVASAIVAEVTAADPELRRSLPVGAVAAPRGLADAIDAARKDLMAALATMPTEQVATRLLRQFDESQRAKPVSPLQQLDAVRDLTTRSVVRLREGLRPALSDAGGRCRLTAGGRFVEAPAACGDALRALATGAEVTVQDLPGVEGNIAVALVRRALTEGIVIPA